MNELIIKIGKLIKEKRLEKGYSTQELADKLNVSAGLINNIENAKTDSFNLTFMENICATLDISLLTMLAREPKEIMDLLSISPEIPEQLSDRINKIINEYINAAIQFNFDSNKLNALTSKLLSEITFLRNF